MKYAEEWLLLTCFGGLILMIVLAIKIAATAGACQ